MKVETQCSQNEELKFPGTLRNHNVFNFINVHKYIGLKPMKHYDFKRHYVSALSKGGFSIHINPVIMIARCQCFTSIVCQMNENASTLLQLWRSTMRAKRRTEQEQYEIMMECRQSGLSDHQWCLEHDINPGTFFTRSVVFASRLVNFQNQQKKTGFRRSIRKL